MIKTARCIMPFRCIAFTLKSTNASLLSVIRNNIRTKHYQSNSIIMMNVYNQNKRYFSSNILKRESAISSNTTNNSQDLLITESCGRRIQEANEKKGDPGRMLRVIVESGGCSGYQVEFTFSKEIEPGDQVFYHPSYPNSKVLADEITMSFIKGSTIDFVESMAKTAFVLEKNPNAETGCSCGTSFSVKTK